MFDRILKLTSINDATIENADSIVDNQFILYGSLDSVTFKNGVDWDYKHHVSPNTYQLYLHSLMPISFLGNAYEETRDSTYIDKAVEILQDWIHFENGNHNNNFAWYDHSSAYRTHNLIYLYLCLYDSGFDHSYLDNLIIRHADYLYSDEFYRKNNHGVMMDRALIQLGIVYKYTESKNLINKGLYRLKDNFYNNYSSRGVHLENSPEYHSVVEKLFISIEDFLNKYDLTLGQDIIGKYGLIEDYYKYIVKPDGFLPTIGDSSKKKFNNVKKVYSSICDIDAGISILQSENALNPKDSTWLSFVCGYSTLTHKHVDDLSITLFYNGDDIFVDSGKHSYGSSPARKYVRSAKAHNTVVVNDKNYKLPDPIAAKKMISITDFTTNNIYDFVKGKNLSYEGVQIERSLLFLKPDICIILDKMVSKKKNKYSQLFTLGTDISVIQSNTNHTIIKAPNSEIHIEQMNKVEKAIVHKGNKNTPYAVISEKFSQLTETNQLEFIQRGEYSFFLTVIKMGAGKERISNIKFDSIKSVLSFELDSSPFSFVI